MSILSANDVNEVVFAMNKTIAEKNLIIDRQARQLAAAVEGLENIAHYSPMVLTSYPPKDYASYTATDTLTRIKEMK